MRDLLRYPELENYSSEKTYEIVHEGTADSSQGTYEIIFWLDGYRYYCFVAAKSMVEALGYFFQAHPHISYEMVEEHMEV